MSKLGLFLFITSAFMIDYQYEYALYLKNGGGGTEFLFYGMNFPTDFILNYLPSICSLFLCICFFNRLKTDIKNKVFDSIYPTLMVAQGTFYTFVGVCSVLLVCSISSDSIQILLSGLKLAFVSSAIGLFFSIIAKLKIKQAISLYQQEKSVHNVYYDENDICTILISISEKLDANNKLLTEQNTKICNEIKASNSMAIEKLDTMLRSLNKTLTTNIEKAFSSIKENTQKMNLHLANANGHISTINNALYDIHNTLSNFNTQLKNETNKLQANISNFNKLNSEAYREFEEKITSTVNIIKSSTDTIANTMNIIIKKVDELDPIMNTKVQEINKSIATIIAKNITTIDTTFNNLTKKTTEVMDVHQKVYEHITNNLKGLDENFNHTTQKLTETMDNKVQEIDITISNIITEKTDDVVKSFDQLNQKFINIYEVLKLELDEINNAITPDKLKILEDISTNIQNINEATNNYKLAMEKQENNIRAIDERIALANKTIIQAGDDISSNRKDIVEEFHKLSNALIQESNYFNTTITQKVMEDLKTEQEKFVHELNEIVLSIVGVIGDLVKKVKDENISEINKINKNIADLKKRNE